MENKVGAHDGVAVVGFYGVFRRRMPGVNKVHIVKHPGPGHKLLGAGAVLLICALLEKEQLKAYLAVCDALGLSALVEAHDAREIETALACGARMIGVNNRNLRDFSVDTENAARLRAMVPKDVLFVSESGVKTRADVIKIEKSGADAVLIGETLMRADDIHEKMRELKGDEDQDMRA